LYLWPLHSGRAIVHARVVLHLWHHVDCSRTQLVSGLTTRDAKVYALVACSR
jgi:hypothetical protein